MTSIAFDGRFAVADSKSVCAGRKIFGQHPKLVAVGTAVYGLTGLYGLMPAWIKWLEDGADPRMLPVHGDKDNDVGNFLVFKDGKCTVYSHFVPYPVPEPVPCAFGSGREYALGAMYAGANAIKAVEVACQLDNGSGGNLQVIDIHEL